MPPCPQPVLLAVLLSLCPAPVAAQSPETLLPPALLNSTGATDTAPDDEVAIDVEASGRAIAMFTAVDPVDGDFDIHFTYSYDHGASWEPSAPANSLIASAAGSEIEPTIVSHGNAWRYAYARSAGSGSEHDIYWGSASAILGSFANNGALQSDAMSDVLDDRVPHLASAGPDSSTLTSVCVWQRESAAGD